MKRNTGRVVGALVLAAGSVGAIGAVLMKKRASRRSRTVTDVWARPGMLVTFRAELMPGHNRARRTFKVKELLPSGRILLHEAGGEHTETEFEHVER